MKIRSLQYYISEAFRGIIKNKLMAFASIATVSSCVFMLTLSVCIVMNLNGFLSKLESTIGLTIYIEDHLSAEQVNVLYEKIKGLDNVRHIRFVSSDEALENFRRDLGENSILLDGLERDNPLPRSFNIEMYDSKLQPELIAELERFRHEGIELIRFQDYIVDVLTALSNALGIAGAVVISIFLAVSIVIITNTIRITVNSRRLEINIMKFVGATDWFIRWPFIIEGILIGLIGSAIPLAISLSGYNHVLAVVYERIPLLHNIVTFIPAADIFRMLTPVCLIFGVAIGVAGSAASIRKHLNV